MCTRIGVLFFAPTNGSPHSGEQYGLRSASGRLVVEASVQCSNSCLFPPIIAAQTSGNFVCTSMSGSLNLEVVWYIGMGL